MSRSTHVNQLDAEEVRRDLLGKTTYANAAGSNVTPWNDLSDNARSLWIDLALAQESKVAQRSHV